MRRLLVDTHVLLWWLGDDARLGPRSRDLISDPANAVFVSAATAWEISIKRSIGKLEAPEGLDGIVEEEGFEKLPISFFHAEQAGSLPQHHRDPFDRMLIAQSQAEGLEVVTADKVFAQYALRIVDALA